MKTYRIHITPTWRFRFEAPVFPCWKKALVRIVGWKIEEVTQP